MRSPVVCFFSPAQLCFCCRLQPNLSLPESLPSLWFTTCPFVLAPFPSAACLFHGLVMSSSQCGLLELPSALHGEDVLVRKNVEIHVQN